MKVPWTGSHRPKHDMQEALRSSWSYISKKEARVVMINWYGRSLWHWLHLSSGLYFACATLLTIIVGRSISFQNTVCLPLHASPLWIFLQWNMSASLIGYWGDTGELAGRSFDSNLFTQRSAEAIFPALWELLAFLSILRAFWCFIVCFFQSVALVQ